MEARAEQSRVQCNFGVDRESRDDGRPLRHLLDGLPKGAHQGGVRLPRDILGRIEGGKAPYVSFSLIFDRKPLRCGPWRASANSRAVL